MEPTTFDTTAVTFEDRPDCYALIRTWKRGDQTVHEERFRIPKETGPTLFTTRGEIDRRLAGDPVFELTDSPTDTALAVIWRIDGEIVRREAHVVLRAGVEAAAVAAALG